MILLLFLFYTNFDPSYLFIGMLFFSLQAILLACYRLTYNPCELLQILVRVATQPPVDSRYSTAASAVEDARTHKSLARSGEFVDNSVFVLEVQTFFYNSDERI